ncbi:septin-4 isoform X2 [Heliangelus exortis]|uniref:septin-4 isoform X2 n=1 Tax=Heliangelus exortis TaxID=472823 RepID=UPI003A95DF44
MSLGIHLLLVLVNRMWSCPSPGVPMGSAAWELLHTTPSPFLGAIQRCCQQQPRDGQSQGKGVSGTRCRNGHSLSIAVGGSVAPLDDGCSCPPKPFAHGLLMAWFRSPAWAVPWDCRDGKFLSPVLRPCEWASRRSQASACHPPALSPLPAPLPLQFISSCCLSHPFGVSSASSWKAMGCVGVLATPEDPKELRGTQGEGSCPPVCQEPAVIPVPQAIKRFLKEDSEEAELTQFLRDCPPADSSRKAEPPESRRDPSHPSCGLGRVPLDEPANERDTRIFSQSRPSDFQQHIAAPPPPSPNRPRSPWGQLDPYDSSEDDKEYVGFATLPNQVHRKSVKKGFDFTLMVAGESGLGKSTLVNSLFLTDMYRDRKLLNAEERITQTVEITKHVVDIEEKGVKLRLTIVDTPGFGDAVNNTECWKPVADYIDQQFEQYFRDESGLNRKNIQDNRVHCCIYFISPFGHGLRPLDVEFMRALHQRVNIVPVLAKADTLTPAEVERMKNKIREEINQYSIRIYQFPECDSDEDEEFKLQDQAMKESIPFAVIGSNTVVEAKGRRIRGRLYPWGIVEVENPSHCDFVKLRTMLVRTHMQDLKDVTRETHYENYRTQCIQSMTRMVVKERNRKRDPSSTLRLCCSDCCAD